MKVFKKMDIAIIIILLGVSIIPNVAFYFINNRNYNVLTAVITVEGKEYKSLEIDNKKEEEILVKVDHGFNKIKIKDGNVTMIEADCRDEVCLRTSAISKPGQTIVCLPHKLVVEIKGEVKDQEDDPILSY